MQDADLRAKASREKRASRKPDSLRRIPAVLRDRMPWQRRPSHTYKPSVNSRWFFLGVYMPPRTPKACRVRGCRSTTTDPSGYCESHKGEGWKAYKPGQSRHQRGYGTKWEVIRARILKRDKGLCQNHLRQGVVKQASCVDHIKAKAHGGTDEDSNLESLCWSCHAAKTARERIK